MTPKGPIQAITIERRRITKEQAAAQIAKQKAQMDADCLRVTQKHLADIEAMKPLAAQIAATPFAAELLALLDDYGKRTNLFEAFKQVMGAGQ